MKEGKTDEAMALVALIANILARVSVMLHPVMPETTRKIATALGFEIDNSSWTQLIIEKSMLASFTITQIPPLFPRIEEVKLEQAEEAPKEEKKEASNAEEGIALIGIDDFFKTSIKIGTIIEAQEIEKSDRLLLLKVDIGEASPRQVVAGIKEFYSPQDLLDTQICLVANLKPAKLMGNKSEGMILAAKDKNGLSLIRPEAPKSNGTTVG